MLEHRYSRMQVDAPSCLVPACATECFVFRLATLTCHIISCSCALSGSLLCPTLELRRCTIMSNWHYQCGRCPNLLPGYAPSHWAQSDAATGSTTSAARGICRIAHGAQGACGACTGPEQQPQTAAAQHRAAAGSCSSGGIAAGVSCAAACCRDRAGVDKLA